MCGDLPAEGVRWHVVDEGLRAVDLDHRKQLPVAPLEVGIPGDVHLAQLEVHLRAELVEGRPRPLAQVAAGRVVEDDAYYGYRPRVVVASATRCTATP